MDVTTYDELAREVCNRVGWTFEDLTDEQWEAVRSAINGALPKVWNACWHPDTMRTERVTLRNTWSASTDYEEGDEVYHPGSNAYYICALAHDGQAPATFDGEEWTTDYARWIRVDESAEDIDQGEWTDATAYALGERVTFNDATYQCIQAHTSSTSLLPVDGGVWFEVAAFDFTVPAYASGRAVIGRVRTAAVLHPGQNPGAARLEFEPMEIGFRFTVPPVARPWVEYRMRCPQLTGADWSATATYTVATGAYNVAVTPTTPDTTPASSLQLVDTVTGELRTVTIADGQTTIS